MGSGSARRGGAVTYYKAAVSRVHPLGGPTAGGTLVTLHGSNLADYGGALCRFRSHAVSSQGLSNPRHPLAL